MTSAKYLLSGFAILAVIGLWGCSKSGPVESLPTTDAQIMVNMVSSADSIADFTAAADASVDDGGNLYPTNYGGNSLDKVTDAVTPIRWGRHFFWHQGTSTITVDTTNGGDTSAVVTIDR